MSPFLLSDIRGPFLLGGFARRRGGVRSTMLQYTYGGTPGSDTRIGTKSVSHPHSSNSDIRKTEIGATAVTWLWESTGWRGLIFPVIRGPFPESSFPLEKGRIKLECAVEQRLARQAHNLEVVGS